MGVTLDVSFATDFNTAINVPDLSPLDKADAAVNALQNSSGNRRLDSDPDKAKAMAELNREADAASDLLAKAKTYINEQESSGAMSAEAARTARLNLITKTAEVAGIKSDTSAFAPRGAARTATAQIVSPPLANAAAPFAGVKPIRFPEGSAPGVTSAAEPVPPTVLASSPVPGRNGSVLVGAGKMDVTQDSTGAITVSYPDARGVTQQAKFKDATEFGKFVTTMQSTNGVGSVQAPDGQMMPAVAHLALPAALAKLTPAAVVSTDTAGAPPPGRGPLTTAEVATVTNLLADETRVMHNDKVDAPTLAKIKKDLTTYYSAAGTKDPAAVTQIAAAKDYQALTPLVTRMEAEAKKTYGGKIKVDDGDYGDQCALIANGRGDLAARIEIGHEYVRVQKFDKVDASTPAAVVSTDNAGSPKGGAVLPAVVTPVVAGATAAVAGAAPVVADPAAAAEASAAMTRLTGSDAYKNVLSAKGNEDLKKVVDERLVKADAATINNVYDKINNRIFMGHMEHAKQLTTLQDAIPLSLDRAQELLGPELWQLYKQETTGLNLANPGDKKLSDDILNLMTTGEFHKLPPDVQKYAINADTAGQLQGTIKDLVRAKAPGGNELPQSQAVTDLLLSDGFKALPPELKAWASVRSLWSDDLATSLKTVVNSPKDKLDFANLDPEAKNALVHGAENPDVQRAAQYGIQTGTAHESVHTTLSNAAKDVMHSTDFTKLDPSTRAAATLRLLGAGKMSVGNVASLLKSSSDVLTDKSASADKKSAVFLTLDRPVSAGVGAVSYPDRRS